MSKQKQHAAKSGQEKAEANKGKRGGKFAACDEQIEKLLLAFEPRVNPEERPLPPDRKRKQRGHKRRT